MAKCKIRTDLVEKEYVEEIAVGNTEQSGVFTESGKEYDYRWNGENEENFQVQIDGVWYDAESIDYEFIDN